MTRPILARIEPAAFCHNYVLAQRLANGAFTWAVVKANAYGHGLMECADAIRDSAHGFALLEIGEAMNLRAAGFQQPILLLEGFFAEADLLLAAENNLSVTIHCEEQLRLLELADISRTVDVFVKLNTGMNRLGFLPALLPHILQRLKASGKVARTRLMTHFACADEAEIDSPLSLFNAAAAGTALPKSVANSATLLRFPWAAYDGVRPGILLYGASPIPASKTALQIGLRPVMTLISRVIATQELMPGQSVGYGGLFTADRPMRIGVVACGYADGYPRHAPTGTPILVSGQRSRVLGRVSMDMLACDLSGISADVGSSVTLWGEGLPADEVAMAAGTISYELFCALAPRVPRVVG